MWHDLTLQTSLFAKTFIVLSLQLFVTWLTTLAFLKLIYYLHVKRHPEIHATKTSAGELDLNIAVGKKYLIFSLSLFVINIVLLVALLFSTSQPAIAIPLFTAWSIVTGLTLGLALISVDENLGARVMSITAFITLLCAGIGLYTDLDFSFLGNILFFALVGLIGLNIVNMFRRISKKSIRLKAILGCLVFIGYLLFDFYRLREASNSRLNDWPTAIDFAIDIYLDIINLFLDLLELLSNES